VLQCVAVSFSCVEDLAEPSTEFLRCVAVCFSVLQCVAVSFSCVDNVAEPSTEFLRCVVVCGSVLQCVAVCYSVLQCRFRVLKILQSLPPSL